MKKIIEKNQTAIMEALEPLRRAIYGYINDLDKPENLAEALETWKRYRQNINNQGVGVLIAVNQWGIAPFELAHDPEKDAGQMRADREFMN